MTVDRAAAAKFAGESTGSWGLDLSGVEETECGWYFPRIGPESLDPEEAIPGSTGLIVSKTDGAVLELGSTRTAERDIYFYDKGFRSEVYDLVILDVSDLDAAVEIVQGIGPTTVEPEYEAGSVWRIAAPLSKSEILQRLSHPPALFSDIQLYLHLELLEEAEMSGVFTYRVFPRKRSSS